MKKQEKVILGSDLYTPQYRYADLNTGIRMAFVELGQKNGSPIVLLHGATDSYLSFSQMAPIIAEHGYRVIIPEFRGHGKSSAPESLYVIEAHTADVYALLKMLDMQDAHIVGHSLGSFVAQKLAAEYTASVSSLTLIGTAATLSGNAVLEWILEGDDNFGGINHLQSLPDAFLLEWTASSNYDKNFISKTLEHAKALPIETWRNVFGGASISDFADPSSITVPVQIVYGNEDVFFSKDMQMELIARLGSKSILYLEKKGMGHNTHWEENLGEEIAIDIVRFLSWKNSMV